MNITHAALKSVQCKNIVCFNFDVCEMKCFWLLFKSIVVHISVYGSCVLTCDLCVCGFMSSKSPFNYRLSFRLILLILFAFAVTSGRCIDSFCLDAQYSICSKLNLTRYMCAIEMQSNWIWFRTFECLRCILPDFYHIYSKIKALISIDDLLDFIP